MLRTILFILIAALTAGAPAFAAKKGKAKAKKHFKAGNALLETEDYRAAAAEFERSIELYPTKNALFNAANCYKALHEYGRALKTVEKLKQLFGDKLNQEWRDEVSTFEETLKSMTSRLTIDVSLTGAQVQLDNEQLGFSPIGEVLILAPGEHTIRVTKDGYQPMERKISLLAQDEKREQFDLEEIVVAPPPPAVVDDPQPVQPDTSESSSRGKLSALFWVGLGGTVVTGAMTGIFLGVANGRVAEFDTAKSARNSASDPVERDRQQAKMDEADEDAQRFGWLGVGFGIAAGALAIGTTVILIRDLKKSPSETQAHTSEKGVRLAATANGLALHF